MLLLEVMLVANNKLVGIVVAGLSQCVCFSYCQPRTIKASFSLTFS